MKDEKNVHPRSLRKKPSVGLSCLFYASAALLLIWALYSATKSELARVPERDATVYTERYGLLTIRFSADPHPPLAAAPVTMSFSPLDSRQNIIKVERITYEYGAGDSEQATGSGVAQPLPGGGGMYVGEALFPYAGRWWINVKIDQGDTSADVRFTIYAE